MDSNALPPPFPPASPPPPLNPPPLPPSVPPPRITPPVPPSRSGGGRGWMIAAIVAMIFLLLSLFVNFGQWMSGVLSVRGGSHTRSVGPRLDEAMLEDNDASEKVAVIDVKGIITSGAIDQSGYSVVDVIKAQLKRAQEDSHVRAVVLRVDSPGGEVLAADEIYRAISDFQDKSGKPVIASMGSLAASGGYYVSAPCRWIVANELTITGSIGVIMHTWNYRGLMNKVGLQPQVYKSGRFKDMLSGERDPGEIPAEERSMVQTLIDETYGRFRSVVDTGRKQAREKNSDGRALAPDWRDYADGRILSGTQAFNLGFVDQLGDFHDAVDRAKKIARVKGDVNLIEYQQRYELADLFHLFGKTEAPVVKVDLGMEAPKLQAGELYFLSPTFLH